MFDNGSAMKIPKFRHDDICNTLGDNGSSKRKNPAKQEESKLVAKLVTVACRDERAFRLFT